ncbi:hypothetical protein PT285_10685 [Lactobacillus sp. ESL0791]|uniref:FIVAR domain-containing protein n=1 Tax=Lactobacillus sp. ESL0791 TaxID=2983234 RepID=UPI0023F92766|nr:SLAP domain-containing protein [Lactobacillus sp. ESL0791]MDF7639867.1 hypothetical protein [Lactobacillus sp. ESL0791]
MQKNKFILGLAAALVLTTSSMLLPSNNAQAAQKETIHVNYSSIYDSKGQFLKSYPGVESTTDVKNATFTTNGKIKKINHKFCYSIGKGGYLPISDVVSLNNLGTLNLSKNTRVYNKYGKKLTYFAGQSASLKKGMPVNYAGKVKPLKNADGKKYFLLNKDYTFSYLPYRKIQGQYYYSLGHGGYIKASNVGMIDQLQVCVHSVTARADKNQSVFDDHGKITKEVLKSGQKITLDRYADTPELLGHSEDGDDDSCFYRIRGTNKFVILETDEVSGNLLPFTRFMHVRATQDANEYDNLGRIFVRHFNEVVKQGTTNNSNPSATVTAGSATQAQTVAKTETPQIKQGEDVAVTRELYLWVPAEQKAELFYELRDNDYASDITRLFIKASDFKYNNFGPQLKPENTVASAKEANNGLASTSDKKSLGDLIAQAPTIEASDKYRLSNERSSYDYYLKQAKQVYDSDIATPEDVSQALTGLQDAQNKLNGAKVVVQDLQHITAQEADKIVTLVYTSIQGKYIGKIPQVTFNQDRTELDLIDNGVKQKLNITDYAEQAK